MDTKLALAMQEQAQYLVPQWRPMSSAPLEKTVLVDLWDASENCRRTDCFYDPETKRWWYEFFEDNEYVLILVPDPIGWFPVLAAPGT